MKTQTTPPALTAAAKAGLSSTLRSLLNQTTLQPPPDISKIIFFQQPTKPRAPVFSQTIILETYLPSLPSVSLSLCLSPSPSLSLPSMCLSLSRSTPPGTRGLYVNLIFFYLLLLLLFAINLIFLLYFFYFCVL